MPVRNGSSSQPSVVGRARARGGRAGPRRRRRRGRPARRRRSRAARRASAPRPGRRTRPGGGSGTARVPRARLGDVVGGDQDRVALVAQLVEQRSIRDALAGRRPTAARRAASRDAPWTSARAIITRWRWPPDSAPKRMSAQPPARRGGAPRRRARAPSARSARHHGVRPYAPISATSSALTGKSSRALSVCGTSAGAPASSTSPRRYRQLAEQRAEQRRLAAAVGPEDRGDLAGLTSNVTPPRTSAPRT